MKLLDIMKKYDRCLVRESAKLTKIYNMILKESEAEEMDEETCPDCGNDPCTCNEDEECDECGNQDLIPEEDFIKDIEEKECDGDTCPIPEEDFFVPEKEDADEPSTSEEEMMSEEDFFAKVNEDDASENKSDETKKKPDDEFMSAAEFFAEASKEDVEDVNEEVELDPGVTMVDAKELLPETEEQKLEESLKSYRRKNHHLFNG